MSAPVTVTLHHPTIPGVSVTVAGKETADKWRAQGWQDREPEAEEPPAE